MKAIVLLSGGVDSATCLGMAVSKEGASNVAALSVVYGQKHVKELQCATNLAEHYTVKHYVVDISTVMQFSNCSLLKQSTLEIEHKPYADQLKEQGAGIVATYVPFRNGLMLSAAGALAMSIFPGEKVSLYYGAHADDAAGRAYPDCSPEFAFAMHEALHIGSGSLLSLYAPLVEMNKTSVVAAGIALNVPYELTWSCYEGKEKACGKCGTCIDRKNAFKENGLEDPIEYENNNNN